ncbi:fimbria/pilus outer membrane usher protein [Pseudomonas sp. PA1(2017)]|uniref:fimbria/pilus outer membrane usher protein n=1 Tax=Pseudomonas sp. PA1(2017) TaxID=1932113 RepID=UPI0009FB1094|nr:fimbria/pilus outer membrane usher protein [Pseudomonas sp. PA1(2017)]
MNELSNVSGSRRIVRSVYRLGFSLLSIVASQYANARENHEFEESFLQGGVGASELAKFSRGHLVEPGTYSLDIVANDIAIGRDMVDFYLLPGDESATPCLTYELLGRIGVDVLKLPSIAPEAQQSCVDLEASVDLASVYYDSAEHRLNISVPQAYLRRNVQGYVDPSQWDRGVTAGLLNYNYNSFYSSRQRSGTQNYLGLTAGFNLGDWRLRSISSYERNDDDSRWQNRQLYAQRDIKTLKSQLTLGDLSSNGNLFDSFSLRGAQLSSDDRMLPDSLSGYAPVVRGQANSNAKVTVTQNGYTIYETNVAPGPFEIKDLYPSGYGGDLNVEVTEADGQVRKFSVPYSSVVRLLRPGAYRYSAAIGQYRDGFDTKSDQPVGQFTYEHGLSNMFTAYAGLQGTRGYHSPMIGTAMNTPVGAFGLDVAHATTKLPTHSAAGAGTQTGKSARLSFSKTLPETGSTVSIAAYRYSTSGFYNLSDAVLAMNDERRRFSVDTRSYGESEASYSLDRYKDRDFQLKRQRSTMQLTLNQSLGDKGSIFMTGIRRNYWGHSKPSTQYQLGYNGSLRHLSYSVSAMRSTDSQGKGNNEVYATLSIPIGARTTASSTASFSDKGSTVRGVLNGTAGANNQYTWGTSATKDHDDNGAVGAHGSYRGSNGMLNASLGRGEDYRQASLGVSGSVVGHSGGITLGQPVSETLAIIEVPGAQGASVVSQNGVKVDGRGYAVVPYLTPYRRNRVEIDPKGTSSYVELRSTSKELVPTAGAIVVKKFETVSGQAAVIDLQLPKGVSVPFGTQVSTVEGTSVGVVGQGSRVIARGLDGSGSLIIRWGESADQQCQVFYTLAPPRKNVSRTRFEHLSAPCTPPRTEMPVAMSEH